MKKNDPGMKSAGDYMAAAIDVLVHRGVLDSRSPAADARLCWGQPWPEDVAWQIWQNAGHGAPEDESPMVPKK